MAENSSIEWTDATFNPWIGCTKVSAACDNCYAETERAVTCLGVAWGAGQPRHRTAASTWKQPLAWNRKAAKEGRRMRVFCASLADVFDAEVPDSWRDDLFVLIAQTPHLDWLLLTKRPKVMRDYADRAARCGEHWLAGKGAPPVRWPLPNVWLGTTAENQQMAEARIPHLLATPAAVRFLSMEPLLGPVDLTCIPWRFNGCTGKTVKTINALTGNITVNDPVFGGGGGVVGLDWVIVGGESGPCARPTHPDWFRSLRDQCAATGVPFLMKQWGEWRPICQGGSDWFDALYRSRKIATEGQDQDVLDEIYGRDCTVPELCLHNDGQHAEVMDIGAWVDGVRPVQAFRVGKKAAGRLLDGVLHDSYPTSAGEGR